MKKLFTLTLLMLFTLVGSVTAQDRKTWDFVNKGFKATTINNLEADATNWTASVSGAKKWAESKARTANTQATCLVDGETWVIPETEGLIFSAKSSAHLNIVYQDNDGPHVWLNGKKDEDAVTIPNVPAGEKLTVIFSSHGGKADRGFKVSTSGVSDENNATTFLSAGKDTIILYNKNAEAVNVKLSATGGGMHFYFFQIGEGDPQVSTNVAYLYDGTEDDISSYLPAREETNATLINVTTTAVTAEELKGYDVVIVGDKVPADNAAADAIKEAMPWTPVLNLNPALYAKWGYGSTLTAMNVGVVKDTKSKLLTDITIQDAEGIKFIELSGETISAIKLGEYFAGDAMPVTAMDLEGAPADDYAVAHIHNEKHNAYIYMPHEAGGIMIGNAINMLAESKSEITAANKPTISRVFKDLKTEVTITAAANLPKAKIYYTTNGDVPTEASTLYEGTFTLTEACTVKAVAIGEGYLLSEPAEMAIEIHQQPKSPAIASVGEDGKTTVTLTCESEDAVIWYNFDETAGNDTLKSTKYTEPFVITMPQNVTAFSVAGGAVFSELTQKRVLVQNPRVVIDVASHFNATYSVGNGNSMFSYGKNGADMYVGEPAGTTTDPETGDEIPFYDESQKREYEYLIEGVENPEWYTAACGEGVVYETLTASNSNIGSDGGYNPQASTDVDALFPISKNCVTFYKVVDNPNAIIQSIGKFQAPLDVVTLANLPNGEVQIYVSADSITWTPVGDPIVKTGYTRMWKKYTRSYDGTDEVYVRVAHSKKTASMDKIHIFDIYIANQGEQSQALKQQLDNEYTNGVQDIEKAPKAATGIYNMNGMRQQGMKRGLNIVVYGDGTVKKVLVK